MEVLCRKGRVHRICARRWYAMRLALSAGALALVGCSTAPEPVPVPNLRIVPTAVVHVPLVLEPSAASVPSPVPAATTPPAPTARPISTAPPVVPPTAAPLIRARPTSAPTPIATGLSKDERYIVFDQVWALVRDNYLYADYNGVDWEATYDATFPLIDAATSDDEFYAIIAEMVGQLNDHHTRFGAPAIVVTEDGAASGRDTSVGIGVVLSLSSDGGFVQTVFPDSPAARADIRPRDRIIAVDGRPYTANDGSLHGAPDSVVRLNVVRPGEKPRDIVLERQEVDGHISPYVRRFHNDIGYVWVSTLWVHDMDGQVSGALTELVAEGDLSGLVIDLRGNPGGWRHVLSGILGHFVRGDVGTFFNRKGSSTPLAVSAPAGPDMRRVPTVVLIDSTTASYAEVMAAVLQRTGSTVIGTPSAGNTETIYAHMLDDGSRLWLAQEGFQLTDGTNLEGMGVLPDIQVDVDWRRYSEADDPQLLEALRVLGGGVK